MIWFIMDLNFLNVIKFPWCYGSPPAWLIPVPVLREGIPGKKMNWNSRRPPSSLSCYPPLQEKDTISSEGPGSLRTGIWNIFIQPVHGGCWQITWHHSFVVSPIIIYWRFSRPPCSLSRPENRAIPFAKEDDRPALYGMQGNPCTRRRLSDRGRITERTSWQGIEN